MTPRALLVTTTLATAALGGATAVAEHDYPERARESVQRTLSLTGAGPYRVEVDDVFGAIQVAAHDGRQVELSATRITYARTDADLQQATREVTLDVSEQAGTVRAYVDGPFRDCKEGRRQTWQRRDYVVRYDFVLKVPRDVAVDLRTVNDGDIKVEGVRRGFQIENVNGGIEMLDIAGAGSARTVNGPVRAVFDENPPGATSFASVNGDIVVYLQGGLSADIMMKTFNGKIYTDFDVTRLPALRPAAERRDGKFIYRSDRGFGVRVGAGGPELSFDAFNGDIRILRSGQ
jgi:hypothetical protein